MGETLLLVFFLESSRDTVSKIRGGFVFVWENHTKKKGRKKTKQKKVSVSHFSHSLATVNPLFYEKSTQKKFIILFRESNKLYKYHLYIRRKLLSHKSTFAKKSKKKFEFEEARFSFPLSLSFAKSRRERLLQALVKEKEEALLLVLVSPLSILGTPQHQNIPTMSPQRSLFLVFFSLSLLVFFAEAKKSSDPPFESPCSVPNNGFRKLQNVGRKLTQCEIVILSSTLLNYDHFHMLNDTRQHEQWNEGMCWVFFSDDRLHLPFANCTTAPGFEKEGVLMCGGWFVVREEYRGFPYTISEGVMNTRVLKTLIHLYFPYAKILGWIDGNKYPLFTLETIREWFANPKTLMVVPIKLGTFRNVRNESDYVFHRGLVVQSNIRPMMKMYDSLGWSDLPVYHGGFRIQRNAPVTQAFGCNWLAEIEAWAKRDQLSLSPMLHKLDIDTPPYLTVLDVNETKKHFQIMIHSHKAHGKTWARQRKRMLRMGAPKQGCENVNSDFRLIDTEFMQSDHFERARKYIEPATKRMTNVLDVGSGNASFSAIAGRLWDLKVTSLDLGNSDFPFDCIISNRGLNFGPTVVWDKEKTPYPLITGIYDLIHIYNFSSPYGPTLKRMADEWSRLLTPNGILVFSATMSVSSNAAIVAGMEENLRTLVVNERIGSEHKEPVLVKGLKRKIDPVFEYFIAFVGSHPPPPPDPPQAAEDENVAPAVDSPPVNISTPPKNHPPEIPLSFDRFALEQGLTN